LKNLFLGILALYRFRICRVKIVALDYIKRFAGYRKLNPRLSESDSLKRLGMEMISYRWICELSFESIGCPPTQ